MKITRIIIPAFQQFQNFDLDLTDPRTGEPLDKVCFIGRNGAGKSTLLRLLNRLLRPLHGVVHYDSFASRSGSAPCLVGISDNGKKYWLVGSPEGFGAAFIGAIEESDLWPALLSGDRPWHHRVVDRQRQGWDKYILPLDAHLLTQDDLVIYSPPDTTSLLPQGRKLPDGSVDRALKLLSSFPVFHEVAGEQVDVFWNVLIYHVKKREQDWQEFLQQPENRSKSVADVEAAFQKSHPEILVEIADLWNRILAAAGLDFDHLAAKKPVQLSDNLEAYVKVRASGERLDYNALSSGMRSFMFRLGHIFSLYFGRDIRRGVLLLDEPENSLFPDFLYDLIDIYTGIVHNTQIFVATHNPIIAAQFRPEERVILEFDDRCHVIPRRGVTPVGDDPNDVLAKDFDVRSIYGREGIVKWERFLELRRLVKQTSDAAQKRELIDEYMQIGNAYNFAADALSPQNA